jgi:hypothetical protein
MTGSAPWAPGALRSRCRPLCAPRSPRFTRPLGTRNPATARPDVGDTRDGCRASAGRSSGRGRSILFQRCPAPARAARRTSRRRLPENRAPATQAGRRDARRWPTALEHEDRHTPPQGGEPKRRRDKRRTRRQAGVSEKRAQGRCCHARFSGTRVAEPVIAEEETTDRRPKRDRRNDWLRVPWAPGVPRPPVCPFSCSAGPKSHELSRALDIAPRRGLTSGTRGTGAGHPPVALRAEAGRFSFSGARLPHARHEEPAGGAYRRIGLQPRKQAVETPEGGRRRSNTRIVTRHRRAASRSGGAAERDGRPVLRRNGSRVDSGPTSHENPLTAHRPHGHLIACSDNSTPSRTSPSHRPFNTQQVQNWQMDSNILKF